MAEKSFGLKQINMIGVGTPAIESSDDLIIKTNGSERIRVLGGGTIGIGTTNPERTLSIAANNPMIQIEGTGGSGKQWSIISSDDTTGAAAASRGGNFVIYDDTSGGLGDVLTLTGVGGSMGLGVQNPGAKLHVSGGNIKVDNGFGIDFSATSEGSGATNVNELLDDYEEGTFTPSLTFATPGTSSFTYSVQSGWYTKIGRMVHYRLEVRLTAFSKGTASGDLRISGLPFTSADFGTGQFTGSFGSFAAPLPTTAGHFPWFGARLNSTEAFFKVLRDDNGWDVFPDPDSNSQYKCDVTVFTP